MAHPDLHCLQIQLFFFSGSKILIFAELHYSGVAGNELTALSDQSIVRSVKPFNSHEHIKSFSTPKINVLIIFAEKK